MEFKEAIAITGYPGLYKFIAQSPGGVIVESLVDGRRFKAPASSKVSSLAEIAIFTDSEDMPLSAVMDKLYAHTGGAATIDHKATAEQLKALFGSFLPDYDRDRVHVSDMKKVVAWFNLLVGAGMTAFTEPEEPEAPEAGDPK